MSDERDLIGSSLEFGDREIAVHVSHDGYILFDDLSFRRRERPDAPMTLEMMTIAGDDAARRRLQEEMREHSVTVKLDSETMSYFEVAADLLEKDKWSLEHSNRLEEIMKDIFWKHVNHRLKSPIFPKE